jgi:hypothetical protein
MFTKKPSLVVLPTIPTGDWRCRDRRNRLMDLNLGDHDSYFTNITKCMQVTTSRTLIKSTVYKFTWISLSKSSLTPSSKFHLSATALTVILCIFLRMEIILSLKAVVSSSVF